MPDRSEAHVILAGCGPGALELAFKLRLKLGSKANILFVPEGADLRFEPHALRAPSEAPHNRALEAREPT